MDAIVSCQRTETDVVRFPSEEGIATPHHAQRGQNVSGASISVPRPRTRQPGAASREAAVAWPQSHPSEAMGLLANWRGGRNGRAIHERERGLS
jgi:hypothetical protein